MTRSTADLCLEELEKVFEELGVPFGRQGSYETAENLPEKFFTYWHDDTKDRQNYDNSHYEEYAVFHIYFYSRNPSDIYNYFEEFFGELEKREGFHRSGHGRDAPSGLSDYFGEETRIIYVRPINQKEDNTNV